MSAMNAIAGAYSADLPLLVISGSPNSKDETARHTIHHTIGEKDFYQSGRCMEPIVSKVLSVRELSDAQGKKHYLFRNAPFDRKYNHHYENHFQKKSTKPFTTVASLASRCILRSHATCLNN